MTSNDCVSIDGIRQDSTPLGTELSALVDGDKVWFRFPPEVPVEPRAEIFLPVALMEAMVRGVPLHVQPPHAISRRLAQNLESIQRVFTTWNDEDFRVVPVQVATDVRPAREEMVLSCYSGGVDSSFTYASHRDEISHLLLVQGFDGQSDDSIWVQNVNARQAFAQSERKQLIPVASNVREFVSRRRLSWNVAHGGVLAAIGATLAPRRLYIPSSFTYSELLPWGSHPLIDPLWSTEGTEVVHHGLHARRTEKTEFIAAHQEILDHLQVCWRGVSGNCGNCPKCVRTSLALHVLGKTSGCLPAYRDRAQLKWLRPGNHASLAFTDDLITFCFRKNRLDLAHPLRRYRRRFLLKYHSQEIAKMLLGSTARRISRKLWPKEWHDDRAKIQAARTYL